MKKLCCLATITFLSAQAYAGIILPELGRSKSQANQSPIAVGYSNRNSATITYAHNDGKVDSSVGYDDKANAGSAALFMTTPKLHMEFGTGFINDDIDYKSASTTDSSTNTYNIDASFAMQFADAFTAGVSASVQRFSTLAASTKTNNNIYTITPAVGMKIQPNMAVGLGVHHVINKEEVVNVGTSFSELPALNTNEIFAGVAYGVDQKIGENGFGVEAVLSHSLKSSEKAGALVVSQGAQSSLEVNGNYTLNDLDLGASLLFSTGKDYNDTRTRSSQAYSIRPEYMVMGPYYVAPTVVYAHSKNSSKFGTDDTSDEKGWLYGLGLGHRTAVCDLELSYHHGTQDITPGTLSLDSNVYAARISLYF